MPTNTLSCKIDMVEPRVKLDRLDTLVTGRDWDMLNCTASLDAITRTAMLTPLCITSQWFAGPATGNYKRWVKADYSLTTAAKWVEKSTKFNGDVYLHSQDVNEKVYTLASWEKNRPVFLSWFAYNAGDDNFVQLECGWNEGGTADVRLRFWADGSVDVYRNSIKVNTGKLTDHWPYPIPIGQAGFDQGSPNRSMAEQTVDVMLIPCRRRELLIISNQGGGCNFLFEDIDPNDSNPTITGPGRFWWYVPVGQATVQFAPLKFNTSGTMLGPATKLRYAPPTGSAFTFASGYDLPGYGAPGITLSLVRADGVTAYTPDGTIDTVRIKAALTGSGDETPFLYYGQSTLPAATANTANSPTTLDDYILAARLNVPESPSDVRFEIDMKSPAAIATAGATKIKTVSNRPFEAKIGTIAIITGRTEAPDYNEALDDASDRLMVAVRDRWKAMETYRFQDRFPLTTMYLSDAFKLMAKAPGYSDSDMDVEFIDFQLPTVGQESSNEFSLEVQEGETPAEIVLKLQEQFCKNFFIGWVPTATGPKFRVKSPAGLGTTEVATLYESDAAAVSGGSSAGSFRKWFRSFRQKELEPEANDIWVTGRNPRTGAPIVAHYANTASQSPTTAVASRPDNWLGEPRRGGLVEPQVIITQAIANWAVGILQTRLPNIRKIAEWESDFLFKSDGAPVWRGDTVYLVGRGRYRVTTLSAENTIEYADGTTSARDMIWRPTKYTGERVAD